MDSDINIQKILITKHISKREVKDPKRILKLKSRKTGNPVLTTERDHNTNNSLQNKTQKNKD